MMLVAKNYNDAFELVKVMFKISPATFSKLSLHSSYELDDLLQWLCHDNSTINTVVIIVVIIIIIPYWLACNYSLCHFMQRSLRNVGLSDSRATPTWLNICINIFDSITAAHLSFTSIRHCKRLIYAVKKSFIMHMLQQSHHSLATDCNSFNFFFFNSNFLQQSYGHPL